MFLDSVEITGSCALNPPSHPAVSQDCALHPPSPLNGVCSLLDALVNGQGQGQTQIQLLAAQKASPREISVGGKGKAALSWSPETREDDGMMSEDRLQATSWETGFKGRGREGAARGMFSTRSVLELVDIKVKFWASPIFWFQLVWGLCACGHKFLPGGDLIPIKTTYQWLELYLYFFRIYSCFINNVAYSFFQIKRVF